MESVEALSGVDTFQYIGIQVLVELSTGEQIRGELYSVDLQRSDILIIRGGFSIEGEVLYLIAAQAVVGFKPLEPINESIEEIQRVPYEELLEAKNALEFIEDDIQSMKTPESPIHTAFNKRWPVRPRPQNIVVSSSEETISHGESNHWNAN
ncbi:uncharacterized protein BBOV_IV000580 [Babesia bovis T2Bo]|uniref:Uncharacterized protein n=1 Tax=Babesia bovis TaxID=5865 RepID=A7AV32_BABBO|nr:uncharacterized protein BBOV_IV000580 [Babesia bovis T2Bo]EDO05658.1 hypothetical protein BBOV_IV000580 [Babesia bovis T2Bo]|eukprot:XP_001609226.1 hypothetical protein [Babesia bovis T2Bo]